MNPNGLTDEQIAARPEPFVSMLCWHCGTPNDTGAFPGVLYEVHPSWERLSAVSVGYYAVAPEEFLLPGEPGCPWPPPGEFQREWVEGDRAFIFYPIEDYPDWGWWKVERARDDELIFRFDNPMYWGEWLPIDTPAIYIPEVSDDE